jgi:hypothetical protein
MASGSGMLFLRCRSVHTFGMRFGIRVVELDRDLRVLRVGDVSKRRLVLPRPRTRHILECSTDAEISVGERGELRLVNELQEEGADEAAEDRSDHRRRDDHERHDPADGARKRHGLAASFGGPQAEDLEQLAHGIPSARTEGRLSEGIRGPRLYFRG